MIAQKQNSPSRFDRRIYALLLAVGFCTLPCRAPQAFCIGHLGGNCRALPTSSNGDAGHRRYRRRAARERSNGGWRGGTVRESVTHAPAFRLVRPSQNSPLSTL
jgi:hypothetical protein